MYVTKAAVQGLLNYAEINADLSTLPATNLTDLTLGDNPPPANIVESDIALTGQLIYTRYLSTGNNQTLGKWSDNGAAHQFMSYPFDQGDSGAGWSMIQLVLVRLNESYAPNGQFYIYRNTTDGTRIGYDAAICVQEVRPYVLDSYNNVSLAVIRSLGFRIVDVMQTAGLPVTVEFLYDGADFNTTGKKMDGKPLEGVQRGVNSTGKWAAFFNAHTNARNVLVKDNGRDFRYVPNPTVSSI